MLKKVQIFKALDIEIKKQKGPAAVKDVYRGHHSLKEELSQPGITIIAEVAGGSPMRGQIRDSYRPSTHAKSFVENGARAISVATDRFLYWGEDKHLSEVRAQVQVPLLRRDFIFEEYQIEESKILGADAVFLVAALLETDRLRDLRTLALSKGLDVVVEVYSEADLKRALAVDAEIVCVVGRDLDTWDASFEDALELLAKVPKDKCFRMVEAGVSTQAQIQKLEEMGIHGVILGDVFLEEFYPGKRLAQILSGIEPVKKVVKGKGKAEVEADLEVEGEEGAVPELEAPKAEPSMKPAKKVAVIAKAVAETTQDVESKAPKKASSDKAEKTPVAAKAPKPVKAAPEKAVGSAKDTKDGKDEKPEPKKAAKTADEKVTQAKAAPAKASKTPSPKPASKAQAEAKSSDKVESAKKSSAKPSTPSKEAAPAAKKSEPKASATKTGKKS